MLLNVDFNYRRKTNALVRDRPAAFASDFPRELLRVLSECKPHSLHAVCTDPPYGVLEFTEKEVSKLRAGRGGVWRLPPTIGGSRRDPLPRFTVLTDAQKLELRCFFLDWGKALFPALVPGAHVCVWRVIQSCNTSFNRH